MSSRLAYRTRQFWNALTGPRLPVPEAALTPQLTATQISLFHRLQPSEQAHACQIFEHLKAAGQTDPHLLTAALLHDIGKVPYPLSLADRVLVVLGMRFFKKSSRRWSEGKPTGLRRPFVVAAHHAEWGADLAQKADADPRTVELIRHHHHAQPGNDPLLSALQAADEDH